MKTQRFSVQLYVAFIAVILLMSLTPVLGGTGSVWTTDSGGVKQDGNAYYDPDNVYLAVNLPDNEPGEQYYFKVTDTQNILLSTDEYGYGNFTVSNGKINWGTHYVNEAAGVIQLSPFNVIDGTCKVWVSSNPEFPASDSKTDNFHIELLQKYFELKVTSGVLGLDSEFFVDYAIDGCEPVRAQLLFDRTEGVHQVFRYETAFPKDTIIYWNFTVTYLEGVEEKEWTSYEYGPEVIDNDGMVNDDTVFLIYGYKFNSTGEPLDGKFVRLYDLSSEPSMMNAIDETLTNTEGYFNLIAAVYDPATDYAVAFQGWDDFSEEFFLFTADGYDKQFNSTDEADPVIQLKLKGKEIAEDFEVVFTPDKKTGLNKLSSTNMGSFQFNTVKTGTPGENYTVQMILPPMNANAIYDYPNFQLHHTSKGAIDVHVFKGTAETKTGDITSSFTINATLDGKYLSVYGPMPEEGAFLVKLHLDFQIEPLLDDDQVSDFHDFEYWFTVIYSPHGVRSVRGVR